MLLGQFRTRGGNGPGRFHTDGDKTRLDPDLDPNSAWVQEFEPKLSYRVQFLDLYVDSDRIYPSGPKLSLGSLPPLYGTTKTSFGGDSHKYISEGPERWIGEN
ncbi:hypothetical protein AMTRI_Chr13g115860 [Amborella trichopoda]